MNKMQIFASELLCKAFFQHWTCIHGDFSDVFLTYGVQHTFCCFEQQRKPPAQCKKYWTAPFPFNISGHCNSPPLSISCALFCDWNIVDSMRCTQEHKAGKMDLVTPLKRGVTFFEGAQERDTYRRWCRIPISHPVIKFFTVFLLQFHNVSILLSIVSASSYDLVPTGSDHKHCHFWHKGSCVSDWPPIRLCAARSSQYWWCLCYICQVPVCPQDSNVSLLFAGKRSCC